MSLRIKESALYLVTLGTTYSVQPLTTKLLGQNWIVFYESYYVTFSAGTTKRSSFGLYLRPNCIPETSNFRDTHLVRIVDIWNAIPNNIKCSISLSSFKGIRKAYARHGSCYGTKGNGQWFQVGERVWYRNRARALRKIFLSPWCGPWEVVKVLSDVTYRIEEEIENLEVVIKGGWSTSTT